MKTKLIAFALLILPVASYAADIASVNFNAIKDDLREYYFTKAENAEIKESLNVASAEDKKRSDDLQAAMAEGKTAIEIKRILPKSGSHERYQLERKLDSDLKKELYRIILNLGLKYELVYDASNSETVIYAKSQVDDVTAIVKQAIIELTKKQ